MMEDMEVARILGQIEGELKGINREIRDIKGVLRCQTEDCDQCKDGINSRFSLAERRIDGLAEIHTGERAVSSWVDSKLARALIFVSIAGGISALVITVLGLVF